MPIFCFVGLRVSSLKTKLSSRKERRTKGQEVGIYIMRTRDDTSLGEYPIRGATIDSITDKLLIVSHGDHCVFCVTLNDSFYDQITTDGQRLVADNHTLDGLLAES